MRPMPKIRARSAGATAVCTTLALVPATGVASAAADTTASPQAGAASGTPKPAGVRKRLTTDVRVASVRRNVLVGRAATVRGALRPGGKGHVVRLQARTSWGWKTIDRALTGKGGFYSLSAKTARPGTLNLRVLFPGDRTARRSQHDAGRLNVFRRAHASWYSLYGNRTACGQVLGYNTLGVAHKTLPCGTKLTLRHNGRSVRVSVIDRGPFIAGREFDLTAATKRALAFGDLGTVLVTR
ncbi:MAG: hypothetical protein JWP18_2115 [Solirubrobacterales bacterium]|nr:hypothetical protein [Solirubrobacterales bacterium]